MPETVSRALLDSLLPPGSLWAPKPGADLDLLLDGIAANTEEMRVFLASLALLRDPQLTIILDDLETEYGIEFNPLLTEQERRDQLTAAKGANQGDGTDDFLQTKLQEAGFDLQVHSNDPPVDPAPLLAATYNIFCDDQTDAYCGNENAICGRSAGQLVVNGGDEAFSVPASSDYWHLIFFIGGDVTRDPVTDEITSVAPAEVPEARADELVRLIVKYKPLHSWCGLIVEFV